MAAPVYRGEQAAGVAGFVLVAASAAVLASAGSWGTAGRLVVSTALPLSVLTLVTSEVGRRTGPLWAVAIVLWPVAWMHILLTSPGAAWVVDSHMAPWVPMPGAATRLVLAWSSPLGWALLLGMAAWLLRRDGEARTAVAILVAAAVSPLFGGSAFPTDAYALLWERGAFSGPVYMASTVAYLVAAAMVLRRSHRPTKVGATPDAGTGGAALRTSRGAGAT